MTSLQASGIALEGRLLPTDLQVDAGQLVAVIGPNGGGKTSLLRSIARVEQASGSVVIDGEDVDRSGIARRQRLLSFLPASREIGWHVAVRDVIALGLPVPDKRRVDELIELFELAELADRPINRLSTGERARALMSRALAARPHVLLLDEPLSNLDPYWVLRFLEILRSCASSGQAVTVALHDLSHLQSFDRVLLVAGGRVEMDDTPARTVASEQFEQIFRIQPAKSGDGWQIRRKADPRSLR